MLSKSTNILKAGNVSLDKYNKIFVTSDLHFGHSNILRWEPNRYEMLEMNYQTAIYKYAINNYTRTEVLAILDNNYNKLERDCNNFYIDEHDKELIRRYNSVVGDNDLVFILGDLSFRNTQQTEKIIQYLNGDKVLIKGNHDNKWLNSSTNIDLFLEILDYKEITYKNKLIVMSHYPMLVWNRQHYNSIHLFGHIHSNEGQSNHILKQSLPNSFNVRSRCE